MDSVEMGRKGGNTTKARHGHDYYVRIGQKGGAAVKRLIENGRKYREEN